MDTRGLDAKLAPVARLGQCDVAHVVFDVEALVFYPIRVVQIQRHPQDFFTKVGELVEPAFHVGQYLLETQHATRRGGLVINMQQREVGVGVGAVGIDVGRVVFAQLAHAKNTF